jgi:hypothetical protein
MTTCQQSPDLAAQYVAGDLAEPERTAFEDHFCGCDRCFRTVQGLQDAAALLAAEQRAADAARPQTSRSLPYKWLAMAATLVVAVAIWNMSDEDPREAVVALAPAAPASEPRPAPTPSPTAVSAPTPALPTKAAAALAASNRLDRWASVSPPQYVPLTTRSAPDTVNEEIQPFNDAMAHYSAGRYGQAAEGLGALAERSPDAAHVHFFLGIAELMRNNVARARGALQRSADSGVSPYADEAHFYLAKAALKAGDLTTATHELQIAVERDAGPDGDAEKLLAEVRNAVK